MPKFINLKELLEKNPRYARILQNNRNVLICKNRKTGKLKKVPFNSLYSNNKNFWRKPSNWSYFLSEEAYEEALESFPDNNSSDSHFYSGSGATEDASAEKGPSTDKPADKSADKQEDFSAETESTPEELPNYGPEWERIQSMSIDKRQGLLEQSKQRLEELADRPDAPREEKMEALVETTRDATLINKSVVGDAMSMADSQAKDYTSNIVNNTVQLVRSTSRVISPDYLNDDMFSRLVERSNGTVVQHMTRVFLNGLAFLKYYRDTLRSSGLATKIRTRFEKKYKPYYKRLLPHLHDDYLTLEHVFLGGMKSLDDSELNTFAVGFLVHDIGKVDDIEYHEGEDGYDRGTVERHVKLGYQAIMNKTNYSRQAAMITGYHHEYYGDPSGYGYFREFLQQYKQNNPKASIDFCIAYDMEAIIDFQALAYFPAKVMEIVDIFDSLTDKNRKYREPLSESGAIDLMQRVFIDEKLKIDPILFDIFKTYLKAR